MWEIGAWLQWIKLEHRVEDLISTWNFFFWHFSLSMFQSEWGGSGYCTELMSQGLRGLEASCWSLRSRSLLEFERWRTLLLKQFLQELQRSTCGKWLSNQTAGNSLVILSFCDPSYSAGFNAVTITQCNLHKVLVLQSCWGTQSRGGCFKGCFTNGLVAARKSKNSTDHRFEPYIKKGIKLKNIHEIQGSHFRILE